MKTFSRLVAMGAVASGAGGILLAVTAAPAGASPTVSASDTTVTSPGNVTVTATVDPLNTAQLYFDGRQVAALANPVQFGKTLSWSFNTAQYGNGSYPVEVKEETASLGLKPLTQTASETITVRIPAAQSSGGSSGASGGSGGSAAGPGAASGSSSAGAGSGGAAGAGSTAPAAIGYSGPAYGGTGYGSAYSRLEALSGSSSLVLPDVAPQNGFQLPIRPAHHARLASSPSRTSSLTAATWLIGLALGLITLLTAAHTGAWARKRHRLSAAGATAGGAAAASSATALTRLSGIRSLASEAEYPAAAESQSSGDPTAGHQRYGARHVAHGPSRWQRLRGARARR